MIFMVKSVNLLQITLRSWLNKRTLNIHLIRRIPNLNIRENSLIGIIIIIKY